VNHLLATSCLLLATVFCVSHRHCCPFFINKKDKPLTFQSWQVDYLLDWILYQLRSLMNYEVPHIWHLHSFTRLIVQFMSIVTVYNIFIGCVCFLHTLSVALFFSFDSRNANWVLLDNGKLCFYHAIAMQLTTIYILLYSVSTKNCVDVIVLVVHCCCRRIEPICFRVDDFWRRFGRTLTCNNLDSVESTLP
jgi:hypothetical protein